MLVLMLEISRNIFRETIGVDSSSLSPDSTPAIDSSSISPESTPAVDSSMWPGMRSRTEIERLRLRPFGSGENLEISSAKVPNFFLKSLRPIFWTIQEDYLEKIIGRWQQSNFIPLEQKMWSKISQITYTLSGAGPKNATPAPGLANNVRLRLRIPDPKGAKISYQD